MGVGHNRVYKEVVLSSIVSSGFPSELGVERQVVKEGIPSHSSETRDKSSRYETKGR